MRKEDQESLLRGKRSVAADAFMVTILYFQLKTYTSTFIKV